MSVYPQLLTGAIAQFRFEKKIEGRAVLNRTADGSTYAAADPAGRRVSWNLGYVGLSGAEFAALESLFSESEGRLGTFTFLDPTGNLLGWTEDFSAAVWHNDATLSVQGAVAGRTGDGFHLVNGGQLWAELWQTVVGPANFSYAFTVWVKGSGAVRLRRFAGASSEELEFALTPDWRRIEIDGALGTSEMGVSFAIGVPAGGAVDLSGPQVEAQLVGGEYKKCVGRGGVYPSARFSMDKLETRIEATDWIDARVSVESRFED